MPLTPNFNIFYRDTSTPASLETESALQADSVDDALVAVTGERSILTYRWANSAERSAQTGMQRGDLGIQGDNGIEYRYSGTTWRAWSSDWISYTPTTTGFSVGTGGNAAANGRYRYEQGRIRVSFRFVLGTSGASMSAQPSFTLPVAAINPPHGNAAYVWGSLGGTIYDSSTAVARLLTVLSNGTSTTSVRLFYLDNVAGILASPTASAPWTWASDDALQGEFIYDPA